MTGAPEAHPLVRQVLARAAALAICHGELTARAGIYANAIHHWTRRGTSPGLAHLEAVAAVVGLRLVLVPETRGDDARAVEKALRDTSRALEALRAAVSDLTIDKTS